MILQGTFFSKSLEMETGLSLITPDSASAEAPAQVVYLLHGLMSSHASWLEYTMLPVYASKYRCVFVMPDVGRSFYTDQAYGQAFFEYVARELPEMCRNTFHISARREDTAVIGGSMGGYGALKCALTYPESFGLCGALAPGCLFLRGFLAEMKQKEHDPAFRAAWGAQFIMDFKAAFGENFTWKPEYEILELAKRAGPARAPRLYAACGTRDSLLDINRRMRDEMEKLGFDYHYEEWEGAHDWPFFNKSLRKSLTYLLKPHKTAIG